MKPIYKAIYLEFSLRELFICIADDIAAAAKHVRSRTKDLYLPYDEGEEGTAGICDITPEGDITLLFAAKSLSGHTICHEVSHATHGLFRSMGIQLNEGSDEAFAYHNGMLFRFVCQLAEKNGLEVPMLNKPISLPPK